VQGANRKAGTLSGEPVKDIEKQAFDQLRELFKEEVVTHISILEVNREVNRGIYDTTIKAKVATTFCPPLDITVRQSISHFDAVMHKHESKAAAAFQKQKKKRTAAGFLDALKEIPDDE